MAGILNDRLKGKIEQIQEYARRRLLDSYGCSVETRNRVAAEITGRISSESKVLLGNAISVLSQDFISRFSGDGEKMNRYFELELEKKIREKYQRDFDCGSELKSNFGDGYIRIKSAGMGVLGAVAGAFVVRRFTASFFTPQVGLAVVAVAALYYLASAKLLSNADKRRHEESVSEVVEGLRLKIVEWLDDMENDFNRTVAAI